MMEYKLRQLEYELETNIDNNLSQWNPTEVIPCNLNTKFPFEANKLCKIENVISIFIDMAGSTQLAIRNQQKATSKIFKSYIESFVTIFDKYGAEYIDIQGDGGFVIFDGSDRQKREKALASAVMTINYLSQTLSPKIRRMFDVDLAVRIGIDYGTVYAKKFGRRNRRGSDYMNEKVWLGKPVSISSKLCNDKSIARDNTIRVSDRFYSKINSRLGISYVNAPSNIPSINYIHIFDTQNCNLNSVFCANNL